MFKAQLIKSVILCFLIPVESGLLAAVRQVTGYGSGDTLEQALFVAQGDAVLNSGAKTTVAIETGGEKLLGDKGVSSNVVFLSEYKILEKGESFDGVYARIQATVCEVSERQFENGKVITGTGKGISPKAAKAAAIGDAIMSMGTQVRAIGIYEKEELVRDDTEFTGWAYVTDIEELEKEENGGTYTSKVKIKVFANKGVAGIKSRDEKKVSGTGSDIFEAMAVARIRAVLGLSSSYVARRTYKTGELALNVVKRNWRGLFYGTEVTGLHESINGWQADLILRFDSLDSQCASGVHQGVGFGIGKTEVDAVEFAKWDAVLNAGSTANIGTTYLDGVAPVEYARLTGEGYIGKVEVERIQPTIIKVTGLVARKGGNVAECELDNSSGCASFEDGYKSYLLARQKAIINGGATYTVDRKYENNKIVESTCDVSASRRLRSFVSENRLNSGLDKLIKIQMKSVPDNVNTVYGVGIGASKDEACELARSDAALNFCSDIDVQMKYNNEHLSESICLMKGGSYLANCEVSVNPLSGGRYMAVAKASAVKDVASADKLLDKKVVFEGRTASSIESSICINRRGLVIQSGAMVTAKTDYKNLEMTSSTATYTSEGVLSGCRLELSEVGNGQCNAKAVGRVLSPGSGEYRSGIEVFGYGKGGNFEEARKAAVADAVINANSNFSAEEKYEQGKYISGQSKYSAEGYLFDCKVLSNAIVQDGRHFVKVLCSISTGRKDELEIAKKNVVVKGWGLNESAATENAKRNAIDIVFGRHATASLEEVDGTVRSSDSAESAFENGYVEESTVKNVVQTMGLYEVEISAVVCQRDKDDSSWSWITAIIVILILIGIIGGIKNKGLATFVWLISAISLFGTGHWAVGLTIAILGLGALKK